MTLTPWYVVKNRAHEIAARARAEATSVPPHTYQAGTAGVCLVCGKGPDWPAHDMDSYTEDNETPNLPVVDDGVLQTSAETEHTGVMVALFPPTEQAERLAVEGGERATSLHVTLAYLGKADDLENIDGLNEVVANFAKDYAPVTGEVSGIGQFTAGPNKVSYASVDLPSLPELRQRLVAALDEAGFPVSKLHGYTPHMTLAFGDLDSDVEIPNEKLSFGALTVAAGAARFDHSLTGPIGQEPDTSYHGVVGPPIDTADHGVIGQAKGALILNELAETLPVPDEGTLSLFQKGEVWYSMNSSGEIKPLPDIRNVAGATKRHKYKHPNGSMHTDSNMGGHGGFKPPVVWPPCDECGEAKDSQYHTDNDDPTQTASNVSTVGAIYVTERLMKAPVSTPVESVKAFVSEVNGKTLITAPASTFQMDGWEKALTPNQHIMWVEGKLVGGEEANRNNAFWSTEDLEFGQPTVVHGPLNWLHESRHIIGALADSKMIKASGTKASEGKPYLAAAAGVWRWIWPDEAYVIEQASDQGKFWYSMECISENVECAGANGCGTKVPYRDYMKGVGDSCSHLRERSSVRRFENPTFLGAAVIVPPVRPGWADADARVMREAASLAEKTFDLANPNLTASEWEILMAQVVEYSRG